MTMITILYLVQAHKNLAFEKIVWPSKLIPVRLFLLKNSRVPLFIGSNLDFLCSLFHKKYDSVHLIFINLYLVLLNKLAFLCVSPRTDLFN